MSLVLVLVIVFFVFASLVPFVLILTFVLLAAKNNRKFQTKVFNSIDNDLYQKIDHAQKPNRYYVKTRCDNCGAKCTNAANISPSGDLQCEYCHTWFNILRT